MGARQVLRVAAVGLILGGLGGATAHAGAPKSEPVIVIDLRSGDAAAMAPSRAQLATQLDQVQGVSVRKDAGLDGALAGEASDADVGDVTGALDAARSAFGALDCKTAAPAADRAIDLLAARQASGLDDGTALRSMWAITLLCADQAGARTKAQVAADRLRALGVASGGDAGISDATWARFPEIDAHAEGAGAAITITTDPPGGNVWIDHVAIGASPVTRVLLPGEHEVAAGAGAKRAATRVTVADAATTVALALVDRTGPFSAVAGVVKGWRDGKLTPTAEALATVMAALNVRFALVLAGKDTVQVWAMGPGDRKPHKVDDASRDDPMGIGAMIVDRVAAWDEHAPDPDRPLLRESLEDRASRDKGPPQRWWVYASILGAVVAASTVLYLEDSATDHQTITIHFP